MCFLSDMRILSSTCAMYRYVSQILLMRFTLINPIWFESTIYHNLKRDVHTSPIKENFNLSHREYGCYDCAILGVTTVGRVTGRTTVRYGRRNCGRCSCRTVLRTGFFGYLLMTFWSTLTASISVRRVSDGARWDCAVHYHRCRLSDTCRAFFWRYWNPPRRSSRCSRRARGEAIELFLAHAYYYYYYYVMYTNKKTIA